MSSDCPFEFKRLHFPVKLCFNIAEGQSLKEVGMCLREERFPHGELYVACSNVGSAKGLHILAPTGNTPNVVYKVLCGYFIIRT
jgi:hypothetical protein